MLQAGFNEMATGLRERDRIRELFGRQVGEGVARTALEGEIELGGEVREVAVLFVDLVGSTEMAFEHPPHEVVAVLNAFFGEVVDVVESHRGWINKFEGDAALAVFGAPDDLDDAAGCALAAARALAERLDARTATTPRPTAGIAVSAGPTVAGNIGDTRRYEYTVIGDPVNEAARLCDVAKGLRGLVAASDAAIRRAGPDEAGALDRGRRPAAARPEPGHPRARAVRPGLARPMIDARRASTHDVHDSGSVADVDDSAHDTAPTASPTTMRGVMPADVLERDPRCPFDPAPGLVERRGGDPVQPLPLANGARAWLVTGFDEARAVLADRRFSNDRIRHPDATQMTAEQAAAGSAAPAVDVPERQDGMFIFMDPPEHTRLRSLLTGQFTVRRMRALEARLTEIAAEHIAAMRAAGTEADLVPSYALPLPVADDLRAARRRLRATARRSRATPRSR